MKKTLLRLFQLLVILSLFFFFFFKKEKDEKQEEVGVKINGVIWATRNVDKPGTFAAKPEDAGMFYQWNRKIGWSSSDPLKNHEGGTVWDNSIPEGESWEKANDPCPPGWRIPTHEEQRNIVNSGSEPAILNGVNGRYFGSGNQKLFFPASGLRYCSDGSLGVVGNFGHYWSSTLFQGDEYKFAHFMFLAWNEYADTHGVTHLNEGFSVRCVKEE
jgi:uncharacterized protein (TIGR02145 family)